MAPKRKSGTKADPRRVKKTRTEKSTPCRRSSGDGGSSAVRSPRIVTPRHLATVVVTPIRCFPRATRRSEPGVIGNGSAMKRKTLGGNVGVLGAASEEEHDLQVKQVDGDSDDNDEMLEETPAAPRKTNTGGAARRLQPLTARLPQSHDERPPGLVQRTDHPSRSSPPSSRLVVTSESPRSVLNLRPEPSNADLDGERTNVTREEIFTNTPAPSSLSMVAELREHQRGLVTATKKLIARSEMRILERFKEIGKEVTALVSMVKDQQKEIESLKEYTNMLMYAVGGKGRDSTSLMTVVRAGVKKVFSSSSVLPVVRKALVSWSVLGLLYDEDRVCPIVICDNGASALRSIFIVRFPASKRNENFVRSQWLKNNQKLRALVVRSMSVYVINDSSNENYVRVPGSTAEETKPSWLRKFRETHIESVLRSIENGTEDAKGLRRTGGNVFRSKEISETVVHRVHSVVVANLNRSRERMRTSFFTNCGFIFDKRVKVVFCDGDCRPISRGIAMIPLPKIGYDLSSCAREVEENEAMWTKLKQECAFMSFFVHYEVDFYDEPSFSDGSERKVLHAIINALHVGLELCLSFTQCSCLDEFFLLSEHSLMMVHMFAIVVRDIILEKVSDISCIVSEKEQGDNPRRIEDLSSSSEYLSMTQLCAFIQLQKELDICSKWSEDYCMEWNTEPGKSEALLPPRGNVHNFTLAGKVLQNVKYSVYLGVSLTTSGVTAAKYVKRVQAAQRRLMQLSPIGIHVKGFDTRMCVMLYLVFVRSVYEYGLHLVPLTLPLRLAVSKLETCFFRLILGKVATRFGSSRLPRLRSVCRLESLELRRLIMAQKRLEYYRSRRLSAISLARDDPERSRVLRYACEKLTMFASHPSTLSLCPRLDALSKSNTLEFQRKEWNAACKNKRRPIPETRKRSLPPVLLLPNRHHRLLGVRWYFGDFPPQPTLVRERLGQDSGLVDKLGELLKKPLLTIDENQELETALSAISRVVISL